MSIYDGQERQVPDSPESSKRQFGLPLPGEPALMTTFEKHQLGDVQRRFQSTISMLQSNP